MCCGGRRQAGLQQAAGGGLCAKVIATTTLARCPCGWQGEEEGMYLFWHLMHKIFRASKQGKGNEYMTWLVTEWLLLSCMALVVLTTLLRWW